MSKFIFQGMLFGLAFSLLTAPSAAAEIPPVPAKDGVGFFIHDYAGLLDDNAVERIKAAQEKAFNDFDTPVIVVTIPSMAKYQHNGTIETLATEWFNKWRIGTEDREGGANKGILVLVSVGDRKARIELGGDWGRGWDAYCERVMDRDMIPFFKQQQYGRGIANGVESLLAMAESGPTGTAPELQVRQPPEGEGNGDGGGSLLPGLGSCCGWPMMIILFILSSFFPGRGGRGGYSGGGGFSGGGFSGGSSGGGGASGSW